MQLPKLNSHSSSPFLRNFFPTFLTEFYILTSYLTSSSSIPSMISSNSNDRCQGSSMTEKSLSKWFSNKSFKLRLPRRYRKTDKPSPPVSPVTSSGRIHELQEAFRYFDSDGDGKISSKELRRFFVSVGEEISKEEAETVIGDLDTDGDNLMSFKDFVRLMESDGGDERADDLRKAFEMFEAEKGAGCITPNGLKRMLNRLGEEKSYEDCETMIRCFDLDGNGVLDFHEFYRMMA